MDVKLPRLGEGAESGTVVSLLVKEGDQVEKGQTLLELENEKAVAPIPSPVAGAIGKIHVKVGDKLSVGQLILSLGDGGGPASAPAKPKPAAQPEAAPAPAAGAPEAPPPAEEGAESSLPPSGFAPAAPPTIRKLARELGIDLTRLRGSGSGGRILMNDLRAYIQRLEKLAAQALSPRPSAAKSAPAERIDFSQWGPVSTRAMSPLRQTISRRLSESWNAIPHVTQFDEADITELMALRKKHAAAYEAKGAKLTLTPLVIKAVVSTLQRHPAFNSSLDETTQEQVFKAYYHIGLAVDTEQGLIVPVIRDADKKGLIELARETHDLAEKARARKVSLDDLKGGTFTISNQGGIGGAHFTPIINRPEVAILGLGRGALKPVVQEDQIVPRLLLPLGLSYDHRLIDGAAAARFMVDLVQALQSFQEDAVRI